VTLSYICAHAEATADIKIILNMCKRRSGGPTSLKYCASRSPLSAFCACGEGGTRSPQKTQTAHYTLTPSHLTFVYHSHGKCTNMISGDRPSAQSAAQNTIEHSKFLYLNSSFRLRPAHTAQHSCQIVTRPTHPSDGPATH
jgi:hypothetical protein